MKVPIWRRRNLAGILVILLASTYLLAQNSQPAPEVQSTPVANAEELRKKALNPVADLISVPIQENWNFGIQPGDRTQNVLNIQPVIPVDLSKNWNLIIRWITPVVYQPVTVPQLSGSNVQTGGSTSP